LIRISRKKGGRVGRRKKKIKIGITNECLVRERGMGGQNNELGESSVKLQEPSERTGKHHIQKSSWDISRKEKEDRMLAQERRFKRTATQKGEVVGRRRRCERNWDG